MILAGTVAMESMGFETLGFAGGRIDAWQPDEVNWGPEGEWLAADRRNEDGELEHPFGATQMGLIYVNPQGPGGNPDPQAAALRAEILDSGLSTAELVKAAWASASTFRGTDMRGGANGARIRLAPQNDWAANDPTELDRVLETLERIRSDFNSAQPGDKRVSLADLIVLGGTAVIEQAAARAGVDVDVPFVPGRMDASQERTDVDSFALLEPTADGFRNYFAGVATRSPAEMLVEKAALLNLTIPEMTVLVGGMRGMSANAGGYSRRVHRPSRHTEQRLLRQPGRHVNALDQVVGRGHL